MQIGIFLLRCTVLKWVKWSDFRVASSHKVARFFSRMGWGCGVGDPSGGWWHAAGAAAATGITTPPPRHFHGYGPTGAVAMEGWGGVGCSETRGRSERVRERAAGGGEVRGGKGRRGGTRGEGAAHRRNSRRRRRERGSAAWAAQTGTYNGPGRTLASLQEKKPLSRRGSA